MRGIPWSTIALGSLLLISVCSKGGQEAQSPQPEKSKPPAKTEQHGRILGIRGVKIDPKRQDESYGRFAWIYDSDGNKIELWQPLAAKK